MVAPTNFLVAKNFQPFRLVKLQISFAIYFRASQFATLTSEELIQILIFCGVHFILSYKEDTKVHTVTWHTVIVIEKNKIVSEWQKIKVQGRMFNACDWSNTISTHIILSVSIQSQCLQLGRKKGLIMPWLSKQVTL